MQNSASGDRISFDAIELFNYKSNEWLSRRSALKNINIMNFAGTLSPTIMFYIFISVKLSQIRSLTHVAFTNGVLPICYFSNTNQFRIYKAL